MFNHVIRLDPNFAAGHYGRGMCYISLDDYAEAAAALRETVRLEPSYTPAIYNLGVCYLVLGDRASALRVYRELRHVDPSHAKLLLVQMEG